MVNNYKILKHVYKDTVRFEQLYNQNKSDTIIDVEIRVNWKCNARCAMCGLENYIENCNEERKTEMSYSQIEKLLFDLKNMGFQGVTFSGGEPTLRKDMVQIIEFASKKCNMNVSLNTNGYLLETLVGEYIEAGLNNITISILSPDAAVNDRLMGLRNGLAHTKKLISYINNIKNRKVNIYVNTVVLKQNIDTFHLFPKFLAKYAINNLNLSPTSILTEWDEWTATDSNLKPKIEQIIVLKKKTIPYINSFDFPFVVKDPFAEEVEEIEKNLNVVFEGRNKTCFVPWFHSVIQSNGDVIPCCYAPDDYIMGNVNDDSIEKIWNEERYILFREKCKSCAMKMCQSCTQYQLVNKKIENKIKRH